jgi:hypothetical protein
VIDEQIIVIVIVIVIILGLGAPKEEAERGQWPTTPLGKYSR